MSEHEIQNEILHWLNSQSEFFAWRNQSQGTFDPVRKIYLKKAGFDIKGVSDILAIRWPEGTLYAIEVKNKDATELSLSMEQRAFIKKINSMGGRAIWVKSLEQVKEFVNVRRA